MKITDFKEKYIPNTFIFQRKFNFMLILLKFAKNVRINGTAAQSIKKLEYILPNLKKIYRQF